MKVTTEGNYRIYIYTYGIISVLNVLTHLEEIENYEECNKIMKAISAHEEVTGQKLFTKITSKNIRDVVKGYKEFCLTGEFVIESSEYYADIIMEELINKFSVRLIPSADEF